MSVVNNLIQAAMNNAHSLEHIRQSSDPQALQQLNELEPTPAQQNEAAALALALGQPHKVLDWTQEPLLRAAALLRLGKSSEVLSLLENLPQNARTALLKARAAWQLDQPHCLEWAHLAEELGKKEGDAPASIATATLLGEIQVVNLPTKPYRALRVLAHGLRIAELAQLDADPHLLAILSHVHKRIDTQKHRETAQKALERAPERSPAKVLALWALKQEEKAQAQAQAGHLNSVWWKKIIALQDVKN